MLGNLAEIAQLPQEKRHEYEQSLKYYRDLNNVIDTAFDEGKIEGKLEGQMVIIKTMLDNGLDLETISKLTGLSMSDIKRLHDR